MQQYKQVLIALAAGIVAFLACAYILLMLGSVFMILPILILPVEVCMVMGWLVTAFAVWHGWNAGVWAYSVVMYRALFARF